MGWSHTRGFTRKDVIKELITDHGGYELVAKRIVGNHLWVVWNPPGEKIPFIALYLLRGDRSFGWGHKDMAECEYPLYFTCPEKLLELAPETCPEWREGVRAYHEKRKRKLVVGVTYELPGCKPDRVTLSSIKPLRGYGPNGKLYRIRKNSLGETMPESPTFTTLEAACS